MKKATMFEKLKLMFTPVYRVGYDMGDAKGDKNVKVTLKKMNGVIYLVKKEVTQTP